MALRVCMVTPFAWSRPHAVNEHIAGAARELRRRGHDVVVLAPSTRASELAVGRRALKRLLRDGRPLDGVVALGPAIPVAPGSRLGVPVGVRANLELALTADRFDVVHVHEPGLPSLSYLALRDAAASRSRRSIRPSASDTPRGASSVRSCSAAPTLSPRRRRTSSQPRATAFQVSTGCFRSASTRLPRPSRAAGSRSNGGPTTPSAGGSP